MPEHSKNESLVELVYHMALKRKPNQDELVNWSGFLEKSSAEEFIKRVSKSDEYQMKNKVTSVFYPGHFHSPVVDPTIVKDYVERERQTSVENIHGIPIDLKAMEELWQDMAPAISSAPFTDEEQSAYRYYYSGGPYPYGDGLSLHGLLSVIRPKRIIEIGSGFSTACMLDSMEIFGIEDFEVTCIEPFPQRLKSRLRDQDYEKLTLIEKFVQDVDLSIYDSLEAGDILFIDSTHVMKTGSDVHFQLFHILPRLKKGVYVHVHDVPYPFEYTDKWIYEDNFSWNEAYALRALLYKNTKFKVHFWGSLMRKEFTEQVKDVSEKFALNPGSAIWLETITD